MATIEAKLGIENNARNNGDFFQLGGLLWGPLEIQQKTIPIGSMGLVYLPRCTIKINHMYLDIPYMDPLGMNRILFRMALEYLRSFIIHTINSLFQPHVW